MPERGSTKTGSQWFLEISGNKTGPWTLDQLRDLLKGGKIQPSQKVFSTQNADAEICTVQEALDRAAATAAGTHLPPRPTETVTAEPSAEPIPTRRVDPVLDLFDALQSSKDRKAAQKPQLQPTDSSLPSSNTALFQSKMAWGTLIAVLLGGFAFSAFKLFHRSNELASGLSPTSPIHEKASAPANSTASAPAPVTHTPPPAPQPIHTTAPVKATYTPPPSLPKANFQAARDAERERRQREEELEREKEREKERERDRDRDRDRERDEQLQNPNPANAVNDFAGTNAPIGDGTALTPLQNNQNHPSGVQPSPGMPPNNRVPNAVESQ